MAARLSEVLSSVSSAPDLNGHTRDAIRDKPPIQVTSWEYRCLSAVVDDFRLRGCGPIVDFLAEELDRAEQVEPSMIPSDVVTMYSCVKFVDLDTARVRTAMLVYPGEEDSRGDRIVVITPVGSALIGLRAGATIVWRGMDDRTRCLSVLEVRH